MYFQSIKDRVCGICTFSLLKTGCVGYVLSVHQRQGVWDMYFQSIKDRVCGICTFSSLKTWCVGYVLSVQ